MLNLASETPDTWAPRALAHLDAILLDHTHLEKRAASVALGLLFRYQDHPAWMEPLSALAREELRHFEHMLGVLTKRGLPFERQIPSPYAQMLREAVRSDHKELDSLLCSALVEARSCERMKHLARALPDPDLRTTYEDLLASEARHHHLYLHIASERFGPDTARTRLKALAAHEADVSERVPIQARLHSRL